MYYIIHTIQIFQIKVKNNSTKLITFRVSLCGAEGFYTIVSLLDFIYITIRVQRFCIVPSQTSNSRG